MNYRCQCPKPEGFDLHFKKATMFCERCGTPICIKCSEVKWIDDDCGVVCDQKFYCRTCAELEGLDETK